MANRSPRSFCKRLTWHVAVIVSAVSATSIAAVAAPLTVVNSGFEDISGETPSNEFTFGPLNGWDLYDPAVLTDGGDGPTYFIGTLTPFEPDPIGAPGVFAFFPAGAPEGQRVGIAFSYSGTGGGSEWGLVQTLSDTLQPDTTYTLRVEIGNIASGTSLGGGFFPLDGFPGYRADLLAGGVVLQSDNNSLAASLADGDFAEATVEFTTGATHAQLGLPLGIRLVNLSAVDAAFPSSDLEVDFDDVRLDASPAPVAVPALPLPFGGGLAVLIAGAGALRLSRSGRS